MFRRRKNVTEVLLVHPGGPFFRNRDLGSWSIPKGLYNADEDPLDAARREFLEETGVTPGPDVMPLGECRLRSGKKVVAWAFEGDCAAEVCRSNTFSMEWPPRSGKTQEFPEVDRAAWFTLDEARDRINEAQRPFIDRLTESLERSM